MVNQTLQPVQEQGVLRGFSNLFWQENKKWWGTRRWLVQALIWVLVTNGILAIIMWGENESKETGLELFFIFMHVFLAIGIAVSSQGSIVGEKQSGTAEWVLSKPVSRTAFVFSRTLATWIAAMVVMVSIPALVAFTQITVATGDTIAIRPFLTALSLGALHTTFYLTLTIMLGTFFNSRGPVIGVPLVVLFAPQIAGDLIMNYAPWVFEFIPAAFPQIAPMAALGQPIPNFNPIIATAVWCVIFTVTAFWRFNREEF